MSTRRRNRRRGGADEAPATGRQADYRRLKNPFPVMNAFSDDRIEAIHQAGSEGATVDAVLDVTRRSYQPLYADEIAVLRKIAETRDLSAVTRQERPYLVRFLDSHLVLAYLDGTFWYDVHPLVREQVTGG